MYRGGKKSYKGRGRGGGRGNGFNKHTAVAAAKADSEGDIPMLKPGRNGNYAIWVKKLSKEAGKRFGDLARIYTDDDY